MLRVPGTVLILLLSTTAFYAQEFRGSVVGRVTDPSGAVIAGAKVSVTNVHTNVATTGETNEAGNYQLLFLLPGTYRMLVEAPGFKKLDRTGIEVRTDSRVTVDAQLELGVASDSVTVSGGVPLLETSSSDLTRTIDKDFVQRLDFSGNRNPVTVAALAPGFTGVAGGTYTASTAAQISLNGGGGRRGANEYMVDGVPNMLPGGNLNYVPSMDSVDEVTVHNTMFDASLGHSNGGAIVLTTRSGTNQIHGDALGRFIKPWMNARGWTANKYNQAKSQVDYYQYGIRLDGPVYLPKLYNGKNKTFFVFNLERDNDPRPLVAQGRVPTGLERAGEFSQTLNKQGTPLAIYDPLSTVVNGSNATRTAFAGAKIPQNRLDPTGLAILNLYPLPNQPGNVPIGGINWVVTSAYVVTQKNYMGRVDHYLSDRNRLFFRYGQANRTSDPAGDGFFPGYNGANVGHQRLQLTNLALDDTHTFSPTLIADFRVGFARNAVVNPKGGAGLDPNQLKLPSSIIQNQFKTGFPVFALGESIPQFGSNINQNTQNLATALATITKLTSNHSIKTGFDYRLGRNNQESPGNNAYGNFTVNATFTRSNPFVNTSSNTSGTAMASLLLGVPASGAIGYTSPLSLQNHYIAAFVQDDWKVTPKLTLNFGLRWELETPYSERYNRIAYGFDPAAVWPISAGTTPIRGGVLFAGVNGNSRYGGNIDANNLGPRFGFAWQAAPKTVLRGGFGMFYSSNINNDSFNGQLGTFDANTPFVGTIDNGATPFNTLRNPFPTGFQASVGNKPGITAQAGGSLTVLDQNRLLPYNEQWQISLQRQLPGRVILEAAYLGMHSLKESESFDLNELPDSYLKFGAQQNLSVPNPFFGVFPSNTALGQGATISQGQLWSRYPQFSSITLQDAPTGQSMYHALQVKMDKRISKGLTIVGSYTFSRIMTANTTSLINVRDYRSVGAFDQKHYLRAAFVYQTPFHWQGTFAKHMLDVVAGGWELSGHYSYFTGVPLTVTDANGRPYRIAPVAYSGDVEKRLGDKTDAKGNVLNPYFNTSAFQSLPSQYVVSPEPPFMDELRAPSESSLNLQIFKAFQVRERLKLLVNAEADDVFNHPLFDAPGTNLTNKSTFGVITSDHGGRGITLMFRLRF